VRAGQRVSDRGSEALFALDAFLVRRRESTREALFRRR
jgi:hypothetical protein